MITTKTPGHYGTPESRWAGMGPYYAMFPTAFADKVIRDYTSPGDGVLDPFAGRGSAIFSASIRNRPAIGIEINPLGFVYSNAKLKPGVQGEVVRQLEYIAEDAKRYRQESKELPEFFHYCFSGGVLQFLLAARQNLNWRQSNTDRTLMALIVASLHGKRNRSLSNQMRESTAMSPSYCVRWWREKELTPPDIDPVEFISKRISWRYAHGVPDTNGSRVFLADSTRKLPTFAREVCRGKRAKAKLLITSPPYHNVTNYYADQWLRLWMLGCPEQPTNSIGKNYGGRFSNSQQHRRLVERVFQQSRKLLRDDAIIYVRTDQREATYRNTLDALTVSFPEKRIREVSRPLEPRQQVKPYSRGGAPKRANCEIDLILEPC